MFPKFLNEALSQGLYKEYKRNEYNDANVRGTIDINRHLRSNMPFNGRVAYRTREFSHDNHVTELIRHTIDYISKSRFGRTLLEMIARHVQVLLRLYLQHPITADKKEKV